MRVRHPRGFTLLELAVCALVLGAVLGVLGNRLLYYRAEVERVEVQHMVASMRTSLYAQAALARTPEQLSSLVGTNPVAFLEKPPSNYIGEYYSPDIKYLPRGVWLYDKSHKWLVYLLNNPLFFAHREPNLLVFKVESFRLPHNNAKPTDAPSGFHEGVVLTEVDVTTLEPPVRPPRV